MNLKWIKKGGAIKLRAKAGQARELVEFGVRLANDYSDVDGELRHHRHASMQSFAVIHELSKREVLTQDWERGLPVD
jgi:hypothetical protein